MTETEKTILAYFKSPSEAEDVAAKLHALRAIDVSIDRIGKYAGEGVEQITNPITGDFPGLGHLTLSGDFTNRSAAILAATDPTASGMSDGGQGPPTGRDVLLTAVVHEDVFERAQQLIKDSGGMM